MADTTISTNMFLPIPVVGVDPGPQYATDVNSCLTLIDQHDHSSGYGLQINPSGININADLPINSNNLTLIRSLRFAPQVSTPALPSDLGCLYEGVVDLFYIDGAGNNIRLTQSGGVAGTPGSIANLVSPASASYVASSQKFVWQQDTNKAADMDFASAILRNTTTSSKSLTLSPPPAMAADISMVLPRIPANTSVLNMDSSGNMGTLGILYGFCLGTDTVVVGYGFTVANPAVGQYNLTFNAPFTGKPAVTATAAGRNVIGYTLSTGPDTAGCQLLITDLSGAPVSSPFSVIVIGSQ